jgi:hypothetical protein
MQARPVVTPLGWFASLTEAAAAHGVSKQAVSFKILGSAKGWSIYSEEPSDDTPRNYRTPSPPRPTPGPKPRRARREILICEGLTWDMMRCTFGAKYEEDGKHYCGLHLPSHIAETNERWRQRVKAAKQA